MLHKGYLFQRIAREVVSTMDNGVDATVDRAACLRTLMVLKGTAKILFHSGTNSLDNELGAQLQVVVNGTDIIIHIIVMCGKIGCSNVGHRNAMSVGRAWFGRRMMVHISREGGDIINHRREQWIIARGCVTRRAVVPIRSIGKMNQLGNIARGWSGIWIRLC